jgi:hypothetical protein
MNVIKVELESDSKVHELGVKLEHADDYSSVTFEGKKNCSFWYFSNYFCFTSVYNCFYFVLATFHICEASKHICVLTYCKVHRCFLVTSET